MTLPIAFAPYLFLGIVAVAVLIILPHPLGDRNVQCRAVALGVNGGAESGPTGAPSSRTKNGLRMRLDDQERRRLRDAALKGIQTRPDGVTTAYIVVPWNRDAEPTAVSAAPGGPCKRLWLAPPVPSDQALRDESWPDHDRHTDLLSVARLGRYAKASTKI